MAKLVIVRGIPGSGKSTFAKSHFPGVLILENDMFFMHNGKYCYEPSLIGYAVEWCQKAASFAAENQMDVVIANTFTDPRYIDFYKQLAEKHKLEFEVYHCIGNFQNVHGVPENVLESFSKKMKPYPNEIIIDNTKEQV